MNNKQTGSQLDITGWKHLDKRGRPSREHRARFGDLVNALGGEKDLSPQRHTLAERVTYVGLLLETLQLRFAQGELTHLPQYMGLATLELNLYRALGLSRVPKQIGLQAKLLEAQQTAESTSPQKEG